MHYEEVFGGNVPIKAWVKGVPFEHNAQVQLRYTAMLPIVGPHVAVMPDCHVGTGSTVGSVIPTRKAIIPAAVGVDIGCGMCAVQTTLTSNQVSDNAQELYDAIVKAVPHGSGPKNSNAGNWDRIPDSVASAY